MLAFALALVVASQNVADDRGPTPAPAPAPTPAPTPTPTPTHADRAICASGAALGAFAGAVLGSSAALGMGASLSGFNDAVSTVPELALPPALAAIGAGSAGAATGGPASGWAAGVGALAGGGIATLSIALTTTDTGSVPERNQRFTVLVLVPATMAALIAGGGAAWFAEGRPDAAADP